jgi:hypothetical protein
MMYTELYSFEGTAATDAGKTASTLEKAKLDSQKMLQKRRSALEAIGSILQILKPGAQKSGK